jgi:two-component system OmpR family sensor kinase
MLGPTLRFRMIFLFCAVMGIFLAGTYWIGYEIFAQEARTALDDKLLDIGRLIMADLASRPEDHIAGPHLGGQFLELIDENGNILERSDNLKAIRLDVVPPPVGREPILQTVATRIGTLRVAIVPFVLHQHNLRLIVAEPTTRADQLEANFRENAFGLWTVSLLLTTMIAAWYVGRSLAPIVELNKHAALLTDRVKNASHQDLGARLPVLNPNDEVGRLAINFNELFSRIDAVVRQLRQFVSDAAHELRTPLSVLRGETQFLLSQRRSVDDYQNTLRTIDGELTAMVQIVEGLFTLAMADAGQLRMQQEQLQLDEVLEEACGIVATVARRKQIRIERRRWSEIEFRGDQTLLRQVFLILLENAIKYSSPGTMICVDIAIVQSHPEVSVQDEGVGISPEHLAHIFQRFYRAAPQASDEPRSGGLGLAIADAIIRAHGGSVRCVSEVGKGSTFTLVFPEASVTKQELAHGHPTYIGAGMS